jgi:peptidoglycan/LPS O-acetylase OafA/YrhL
MDVLGGKKMNIEKASVGTCSLKSHWNLVLWLSTLQILLPILMRYLWPANSPDFYHFATLGTSLIFLWNSVLRCYSSSKLKKAIMVWILSSITLIVINMVGFILFNKKASYPGGLVILGSGLLLMLLCLPFIIWFRKKEMSK